MSDLDSAFSKAAKDVQTLSAKPDNSTLLRLYALYKQATLGNARGKRPGFFDLVGQAKFDTWKKLQGMSKETAMQEYINLVNQLLAQ